MRIIAIEGNRQRLDGGAMFGNAPKMLWQKWIKPDEVNRIELATRALLIQTDTYKNILFETGVGAFFQPNLKERYGIIEEEHMLLKNLADQGVSENDIDMVILSHLHFDHAGGLLPKYGESFPSLHFPNALYYVNKTHWERALAPHPRERASFIPHLQERLLESDRLVLIDENSVIDEDIHISFHLSHGHTIGLMISEIKIPSGETLFFVSDLVPGAPWVHLPITMGYDRYPELIVDEKRQLFEIILKKKGTLFFTHDPVSPFATLYKDEKGNYAAKYLPSF